MSTCIRITLTALQQTILQMVLTSSTSEQRHVERAQILLACTADPSNQSVATTCHVHRDTVRKWRLRWLEASPALTAAEAESAGNLKARSRVPSLIRAFLDDVPRTGRPSTFTAEQITQLIALACTPPADLGGTVSHWTPRELAGELQRQQIVRSISPRSVGRFLKGVRPQASSQPLLAE